MRKAFWVAGGASLMGLAVDGWVGDGMDEMSEETSSRGECSEAILSERGWLVDDVRLI